MTTLARPAPTPLITPHGSVEEARALHVLAPVDGVAVPLEELPDPVFSQKMLGDGIAIDPTASKVVAPCAGVMTQFHRARHAFTIETDDGYSVLVHVGIDTVNLDGRGFTPRAQEGDRVSAGQVVLEVDLDRIAQEARSALVIVVVTAGSSELSFRRDEGVVTAGRDEIIRAPSNRAVESGQLATAADDASDVELPPVKIVNAHGVHARPAARLAEEVRKFRATVSLTTGDREANATSVSSVMGLDLVHGSEVRVRARGPQAREAARAVVALLESGLGETPHEGAPVVEERRIVSDRDDVIGGVAASPGLAIGQVKVRSTALPSFPDRSTNAAAERRALRAGLDAGLAELAQEKATFEKRGESEKAQIFAAHRELLEDDSLVADSERAIARGFSAARAFHDAISERADKFAALKSPLLRQRAVDMRDVGLRVLYGIVGQKAPVLELSSDSILVCDDLTPSTVASLTPGSIGAIVTSAGGATSHAAIIARSIGVPYVAGIGKDRERLTDGSKIIVDGSNGTITLDPDETELKHAERAIERARTAEAAHHSAAHEPALTRDGTRVEVAANIGNAKDAAPAVERGCDGVGLLRSEFMFMNRREAPTEEEQRSEYEQIARALGAERSLVVRTLDVGGDKPLAYLPLEEEENPFLGIRGLRLSLRYPEVFRSQLRAVLSAARHTRLNVMFPMVAMRDEFLRARDLLLEEATKQNLADQVSVGIMVEVPSAALNARWLAREVDFFSIGTNDLTQYTLAMDRGHPALSSEADALDPAVLRLIHMTAEAAHAEGKWTGICGGLAAELLATPLLVGMGIDELSVPSPVIPELKARIRELSDSDCRAIAEGALAAPSASVVRSLLHSFAGKN